MFFSNKNRHLFLWLITTFFFTGCNPKNQEPTPAATGNPAIDQLTASITQSPDDASLYAARGEQYYLNESYDEAIADMQKAIELQPDNISYRHLLADVYLDYFQSRPALETMEQTVRDFPGNKPSYLKLAEFQLILKLYDGALATLAQLEKIDPLLADLFFMRGLVYKEMEQADVAIENFKLAVQQDAAIVDAWMNLGQLYAEKGDKIALEYFNTAIEIAPNSVEARHAKGYYLQDVNDLEGAVAVFREIGTLNPQYHEAFYNAGLILLDMDSLQAAFQQFDIAVQTRPAEAKYYYYRGVTLELMGQFDRASKEYEQCLIFDTTFEAAQDGLDRIKKLSE